MRSASKKVFNNIYEVMELLDEDSLVESGNYNVKCFSCFDHRLTEEEACDQIFFYDHAMEQKDSTKSQIYFSHHDKLVNFYHNLYLTTPVYGVLYDLRYSSHIVEFDNIEEYKSHAFLVLEKNYF